MTLTTPRPERSAPHLSPGRRRRLLTLGLPLAAVLVLSVGLGACAFVLAGRPLPWGAVSSLAPGDSTRTYSASRQSWSPEVDRCVTVTVGGTLDGTWTEPARTLRGPGWSGLSVSDAFVNITVTTDCSSDAASADVDTLRIAQYWSTDACSEPVLGDWLPATADALDTTPGQTCGVERTAGLGSFAEQLAGYRQDLLEDRSAATTAPDGEIDGSASAVEQSYSSDLRWRGTVHDAAGCLLGSLAARVEVDGVTADLTFDDVPVCLDPETATAPTA